MNTTLLLLILPLLLSLLQYCGQYYQVVHGIWSIIQACLVYIDSCRRTTVVSPTTGGIILLIGSMHGICFGPEHNTANIPLEKFHKQPTTHPVSYYTVVCSVVRLISKYNT